MHSTIAAMYPRMRTGIFFTPTTEGDGVLLTNGSEVVSFLGASTYAWLDRLSPHLDGSHSVADLTASLPPAPRQMVEKLVGALHEAGLVRDVSQDRAHSLTADELELYATEIAFVEAFHTSPALRFQRYRETRVAVIGSGAVFAAAVEGALLTGVARLSARPTPSGAPRTVYGSASSNSPSRRGGAIPVSGWRPRRSIRPIRWRCATRSRPPIWSSTRLTAPTPARCAHSTGSVPTSGGPSSPSPCTGTRRGWGRRVPRTGRRRGGRAYGSGWASGPKPNGTGPGSSPARCPASSPTT